MRIQEELSRSIQSLRRWLEDEALPFWATVGYDWKGRGFFERIAQDGTPCRTDNRRARVQPRQIYCFATAGRNGWDGPWRPLVESGHESFAPVFKRADGFFGALASPDGQLVDDQFDLYNQAFALLGLLEVGISFPERFGEMESDARKLFSNLRKYYRHHEVGFEEAIPPKRPLRSNPHMHLFEAALAWEQAAAEKAVWEALSDEIAGLTLTLFIDRKSGMLREFFDRDWSPMPGDDGRIIEPGHLFEWSWLLTRWGASRGNGEALGKAKRLFETGVKYGVSSKHGAVVMRINDDLTVRDPVARLWGQTEWMKAAALLACNAFDEERERYLHEVVRACNALELFIAPCKPGLWFDKLNPEGNLINEPAPASSFYHIVCAIYELSGLLEKLVIPPK